MSRLIGAPPGYVGYEDSGTLTKAVRRKPYSVVLLDEIEKAHPDVFNILLQVLDEGHLTDNYGRVIDFKNTVVIMTSNVGARDITKGKPLGFAAPDTRANFERMAEKVKEELQHVFNPEFLNRLDDVIVFHPLSTRAHRADRRHPAQGRAEAPRRGGAHAPADRAASDFLVEARVRRAVRRAAAQASDPDDTSRIRSPRRFSSASSRRATRSRSTSRPTATKLDFRVLTSATKA